MLESWHTGCALQKEPIPASVQTGALGCPHPGYGELKGLCLLSAWFTRVYTWAPPVLTDLDLAAGKTVGPTKRSVPHMTLGIHLEINI